MVFLPEIRFMCISATGKENSPLVTTNTRMMWQIFKSDGCRSVAEKKSPDQFQWICDNSRVRPFDVRAPMYAMLYSVYAAQF